ncbi:MAG: ATP-binding protein [Chitinophagaceae bacterium]|nr:ATP-binding protein [Chitinophagaceae bacterium]
MKNRQQKENLQHKSEETFGRIVVLTGARQTGKTTLARRCFPDYTYISIEDPILRSSYTTLTASQWNQAFPRAILDEVQKAPTLFESIKSVYDQYSEPRYILLGSSQFLLLNSVRESLAGRCQIVELFPLTLPEQLTHSWEEQVKPSIFQDLISGGNPLAGLLPSFLMYPDFAERQSAFDFYLTYGGYPAITHANLKDDERWNWLSNYVRTYLERDIRDLADFRNLEPFVMLQKLTALQTGQLINFSQLGKEAGITSKTAQRFLHYLQISYQTLLLPPWYRNEKKRLIKTPKIHYLDPGVLNTILQKHGAYTGHEYESAIVSELYKQVRTIGQATTFYHLRSHDGREIDLLLEFDTHYLAFEIKMSRNISKTDARNFSELETILDKPVKKCIILSNDPRIQTFGDEIIAIPAALFLT